MARVRECAALAQVSTDIERMPMGYESLVGDMGSTLSGGQKQRVLIARALYRRPRILILDEGTSHLDLENERAVNAALSQLAITRLVVAHRPETLRAAQRVITLEGGVMFEGDQCMTSKQENDYENAESR
jgi:ATP-binding cassette subfamily B protein RaxB